MQTLGRLVSPSSTHLILSRNSTSIMDSQVDEALARILGSLSYVKHVSPENAGSNPNHKLGEPRSPDEERGRHRRLPQARRAYINGTAAKKLIKEMDSLLARVKD